MNDDGIDAGRLRREVRDKYRDVALRPESTFDFYTGRAPGRTPGLSPLHR
jgi:hypothetical protein